MQGKKDYSEKLFSNFQLSERVPKENFYRLLKETLDLSFLRKATTCYYGTEGQKSIDPVVFFKLILVGYLENINSDRKIIEHARLRLDILFFIGYDIDEELPWHSTLSRTRQLYGEEVFLSLFRKVLSMCIDKGMIRGKRQAIDSAYIKANASMDSLVEKEVMEDAGDYAQELTENNDQKVKEENITPKDKSKQKVSSNKRKEVEQHHKWKEEAYKDQPSNVNSKQADEYGNLIRPRFLSNHTHHSPTDPDARISVKPGKARQMNYYAQIAVDELHHVITAAGSDYADKRDSECLAHILNQNIKNLKEHGIQTKQITADTGYSSAEALQFCKDNNIEAFIPNFGQYKPVREGFIYNEEQDQYECTRGNQAILPFKRIAVDIKGYEKKIYRSDNSKCKNCPLRKTCIGKSDFKKIEDSLHRYLYDEMHAKLQTDYAKRIMKKRGSTVEPVLGTMLNYLNLKRVNTRGIKQANKHVMMAALTYNLKKYIKFITKKSLAKVIAMRAEISVSIKTLKTDYVRPLISLLNFQMK